MAVRKSADNSKWAGPQGELGREVAAAAERALAAYVENPTLVDEHVNIERATSEGGYERRQLYELIQNGADALLKAPELHGEGRVEVVLTADALYCANQGAAIDLEGLTAILHSHLSAKRGFEIGRFGLGFKSVLAVTDRPALFSRSVSFEFDPDAAADRVRSAVPSAARTPVLRIAVPIDPVAAVAADPRLAELMVWASTVVRLPRTRPAAHLAEDLLSFPAEFLLFSSHVGEVRLRGIDEGVDRRITLVRADGDVITLTDGARSQMWRLVSSVHRFSERALRGAGEFSERDEVPLHWAVPIEQSTGRGRFWAFFPTHYETTLSGVLNAPWKTQEDRQNLLEGDFNAELIYAAADLIVGRCRLISTEDDPGLHLDKFPARGRESPNWADDRLTQRVYSVGTEYGECLPDMEGVLRSGTELRLHPRGLPIEALEVWASVQGRPPDWCHRSVETRERRARAERLLGKGHTSAQEWLEALLGVGTAEASAAGIRILAIIGDDALAASTPSVLTVDGQWVPANPQTLFILDEPRPVDGLRIVAAEVLAVDGVVEALRALGVRPLDATGELDTLLARPMKAWDDESWTRFWALTRRLEPTETIALLQRRAVQHTIQARTRSGSFRRIVASLLPGPVVGVGDEVVTVDVEYHAADTVLLDLLGATAEPRGGVDVTSEGWFGAYQRAQRAQYLKALTGSGPRPDADYLVFDQTETVAPLSALSALSLGAKARFTTSALSHPAATAGWTMRHRTQAQYPGQDVTGPATWMLRDQGAVETSLGPRACADACGPSLYLLRRYLPVVDLDPDTCDALGIVDDPASLNRDLWAKAIARVRPTHPASEIAALYLAAARSGAPPPKHLVTPLGKPPTGDVVVIPESNGRDRLGLESLGRPHLIVPTDDDAEVLAQSWGLALPDTTTQADVVAVGPSEPETTGEMFPLLAMYLPDEVCARPVVRATEVEVRTPTSRGLNTVAVNSYWDGQSLLVDDDLTDEQVLDEVLRLAAVEIDDVTRQMVLRQRELDEVEDLKAVVRALPSDAERLLRLVGPDSIAAGLPAGLHSAVTTMRGKPLTELETANLALAVNGSEVLDQFREELTALGLSPAPLNGGSRARRFVSELGFPVLFAGSRGETRDPLLRVVGAPPLPALHSYQRTIVDEVRVLLRRGKRNRGLLSLPTGAGKTRVAAEAIIGAVRDGEVRGPIIWMAETDELCEQAVQTWAYLWRALGMGETLAISRLWGNNDIVPIDGELQLVVATIAKLRVVHTQDQYAWLTEADCIVVDEAHMSTSPTYTELLTWLGFTGRSSRQDSVLMGLTATPFRGLSETETKRLVARYGQHRLDKGALGDDPYAELQAQSVLAKVEHTLLGGASVTLSKAEENELRSMRRLPRAVEHRLGEDQGRNEVILREITSFPEDWTCLVFCASVQHAELMAALLTVEGVSAAAISAGTGLSRRRHAIEEFRHGRIRVLTNYGVLTQGFDAPSVRAIVVARPTYSPNVYQQMVGRGLRGPANGGSETCRIVNVEDNVELFGEELAFRQFEYLWSGS